MLYGPISNGGGRERGDVAIRYRIILRVVFKHATVFRSGASGASKIRKKNMINMESIWVHLQKIWLGFSTWGTRGTDSIPY